MLEYVSSKLCAVGQIPPAMQPIHVVKDCICCSLQIACKHCAEGVRTEVYSVPFSELILFVLLFRAARWRTEFGSNESLQIMILRKLHRERYIVTC